MIFPKIEVALTQLVTSFLFYILLATIDVAGQPSIYLPIYILTYIAPLQGNYSEALPGPAKEERLEEFIERTGKVPRITR